MGMKEGNDEVTTKTRILSLELLQVSFGDILYVGSFYVMAGCLGNSLVSFLCLGSAMMFSVYGVSSMSA